MDGLIQFCNEHNASFRLMYAPWGELKQFCLTIEARDFSPVIGKTRQRGSAVGFGKTVDESTSNAIARWMELNRQ